MLRTFKGHRDSQMVIWSTEDESSGTSCHPWSLAGRDILSNEFMYVCTCFLIESNRAAARCWSLTSTICALKRERSGTPKSNMTCREQSIARRWPLYLRMNLASP